MIPKPARMRRRGNARTFQIKDLKVGYVPDPETMKRPWITRWTGKVTARKEELPFRGSQEREKTNGGFQRIHKIVVSRGPESAELVVKPKPVSSELEFRKIERASRILPGTFPKAIAFKEKIPNGPGEIHMQIVKGMPLSAINFASLQAEDKNRIIEELARKINEMHSKGITHHDLKFKNIMVDGRQIRFVDLEKTTFSQFKASKRDRYFDALTVIGNAVYSGLISDAKQLEIFASMAIEGKKNRGYKFSLENLMELRKQSKQSYRLEKQQTYWEERKQTLRTLAEMLEESKNHAKNPIIKGAGRFIQSSLQKGLQA
ncbi:MAG: serine/threonine-protein kinase [Candidatus Diapherotrites archaeon]|nr:serine/threonine-protein kinase [Candidatus Diapherotrites archaeon]